MGVGGILKGGQAGQKGGVGRGGSGEEGRRREWRGRWESGMLVKFLNRIPDPRRPNLKNSKQDSRAPEAKTLQILKFLTIIKDSRSPNRNFNILKNFNIQK